jgi:hypothetical protein
MAVPGGFAGGREESSTLFNAVNARLRLESGAAVPEAEVKRAMKTFAPNPLDSDATIQSKIERMNEFFEMAKEQIGQGRGAQPIQQKNQQPQAAPEGTVVRGKDGRTFRKMGGQWQAI